MKIEINIQHILPKCGAAVVVVFLIFACRSEFQTTGLSEVSYTVDAPEDVQVVIPEALSQSGLQLEVGKGTSLATKKFASVLGISSGLTSASNSFFLRPIGGFAPAESPPSVEIEVDLASKGLELSEDTRAYVVFYHVQTGFDKSQIGLIPLTRDRARQIKFKSVGFGVYEVVAIDFPIVEAISMATKVPIFDQTSGFKNVIDGNWDDADDSFVRDSGFSDAPDETSADEEDDISETTETEDDEADIKEPLPPPAMLSLIDSDIDGGQLKGILNITSPAETEEIDSYMLYWGTDQSTQTQTIDEVNYNESGSTQYQFAENTPIPGEAVVIIAASKNTSGLSSGTALTFIDKAIPANSPAALSIVDQDADADQIQGTLSLSKAASEIDIDTYKIYWGNVAKEKVGETPLAILTANNTNLTQSLAANTPIPSGAVRLLVFATNADGEARIPLSYAFTDLAGCLNAKHTGESCDQCVANFSNFPACDACANNHVTGAECDQCSVEFSNFPSCDQCTNSKQAGLECDECASGFTNFPACDTCANPNASGANCDQCDAGLTNFPACDTCSNPNHGGANCDQCAAGFTNFPACDTCSNPKHTGASCDQCTDQYDPDTYPACNECRTIYMVDECTSCIFPGQDINTYCNTCEDPSIRWPRCYR